MNEQEKKQLAELLKWKSQMEASHSIPLNVDQAFRARFSVISTTIATSAKGATTENQAVNEGGVATYSVLKPPDAFVQVIVSGTTYYIPVFT